MKIRDIEIIQSAIENLKDSLEKLVLNESNLNLIIHNRAELNYILDCIFLTRQEEAFADEICSIVEVDGKQEAVYFLKDEEGNGWQEYHCTHECRKIPVEEIPEFIAYYYHYSEYSVAMELAKSMNRDGVQHKLSCYTRPPFLDGEFKIVQLLSEVECLDWLLDYEKTHNITDIREIRY